MSDINEKLLEKTEAIASDIVDIKIIIAKQEENIKEHIRRSNSLEKHVNLIEDEFRDIRKKYYYFEGALKLISIIALIATIIHGFSNFFNK